MAGEYEPGGGCCGRGRQLKRRKKGWYDERWKNVRDDERRQAGTA
jgi:hypothetical protein